MVEVVYKFDEKSTTSAWKGASTANVPVKLFGGHIHIYTVLPA